MTTPLTRGEFNEFVEQFAGQLNTAFEHVFHKLDDMEQRLQKLESRFDTMQTSMTDIQSKVHTVKNDTRLISPMFELTRMGNADIGLLKVRVENLENSKN